MQQSIDQPLFAFDRTYYSESCRLIAGVDEVGRGPLAGPVVAAAVIFPEPISLPFLNDSKKLTAKKREALYEVIMAQACAAFGAATEAEIDSINIYQATRLAMKRALAKLSLKPDFVLVDGNMKLDIDTRQEAIVKGDQKSACIAGASIIAKVHRDAWMSEADNTYPGYSFSKHKGYGTKVHLEALNRLGPSPIHRQSFAPVREAYEKNSSLV